MEYEIYQHRQADKLLPANIRIEIEGVIRKCCYSTKAGNASKMRKELTLLLSEIGWPNKVRIDAVSKISITSSKKGIGLCLQTGNIGRIYADLLKLQTIYLQNKILAGIIILPTRKAAKEMGQNLANYERLIGELQIFDSTITIPLLVIGIEG